MTRRPAPSPLLLVLVAIASVQFGSSFAKLLFASAPPWVAAWLRLLGAAVILVLLARPRLNGRTRRDWSLVLGYGLSMVAMNVVFYLAIARIPIGVAVTVEFLGPLGVAVLSSRRRRDYLWVGLAAIGVLLLGFQPAALDPLGLALAALAGVFWGVYIILARPTGLRWEGFTGVTMAACIGAVTLFPLVFLPGDHSWVVRPEVWLWGAALGLLSSVIPYGLEMRALRIMHRGTFGILMSLEPAAAALAALVLLGEGLSALELAAMGCVIAASIGAVRSSPSMQPEGQ